MKCKECKSCYKGYFKSKPDTYVCIGVKEPFVIKDINAECTEYPEYRDRKVVSEDSLVITYDYSTPFCDTPTLLIARREGNKFKVLNMIRGDEAFGVYHYLTGGAELKSEKEISKKPLLVDGRHYCPSCRSNNRALGYYCDMCGQKIDWE